MHQRTIVTSALPYVNNIPHLGNMVCIISADIYTRFLRSIGEQVISVIGTDEHGAATQIKALEEGLNPKQITDKYSALQFDIFRWFNTSFDCTGRTSSTQNAQITQDIYAKLKANGFTFEKETDQFYDTVKQMFLADRFIEGTCPHCGYTDARGDQCDKCGKLLESTQLINPRSKVSQSKPELRKSKHVYIDLPKLQPLIEAYVKARESNWSENAKQVARAWLTKNLEPRSISRDLAWGIPIPGLEHKVFYCWFDAPIGYIGITAEHRADWKEWWHDDGNTRLVHFLGKDNIAFHTILFPAFLLGTKDNYTLMHSISANEFLNYADGKFSKSRNTGVFADSAKETGIPADAYRYYLTAIRPETEDTIFDWNDFATKLNKELIDNYCNLVNRVCSFINQHYDGQIPTIGDTSKLIIHDDIQAIKEHYQKIELRSALKSIMALSKRLNGYFQEQQPWKTIKEDKDATGNVLGLLINRIHDVTIAIQPIVPALAEQVYDQLNSPRHTWQDINEFVLVAGHRIKPAIPLLKKMEDSQVAELRAKFMAKDVAGFALDLRVAKVLDVAIHPNAEKLYVLQLDVGNEKRQIVSGLRAYLTPEQVIGQNIVVVANLKKATIRGVESNGMLLAATDPKDTTSLSLLTTKFSKLGEQVFADGLVSTSNEISIDDVKKCTIIVKNRQILANGKQLKTAKENVSTDIVNGIVG